MKRHREPSSIRSVASSFSDALWDAQRLAEEAMDKERANSANHKRGDYWYHHRHELEMGMVFKTNSGSIVKLDGYVPGDGTLMYVADFFDGKWCYQDSTLEPGDLVGNPLTEAEKSALTGKG